MKKIIISVITVLSLAAVILSSCSSKEETSGVVTTDGSTSMEFRRQGYIQSHRFGFRHSGSFGRQMRHRAFKQGSQGR